MDTARAKWIDDVFFFDNLKFVSIFLVCYNHLAWDVTNYTTLFALRLGVPFAMPIFAFASGYSQKNLQSKGFFSKTLSVYFAANLIYIPWAVYYGMRHGQQRTYLSLAVGPSAQVLWYFLALLVWKMITPFVVQFRKPILYSTVLSIALYAVSESLIHGPVGSENEVLTTSLREIIRYYPFYLLGIVATRDHIFWLRKSKIKFVLIPPALIGAYYCGLGVLTNTPAGESLWQAIGYLIVALVCSAAMIAMIPGKSFKYLTPLGQKTMGIYLFHFPALRIAFKVLAAPIIATYAWSTLPFFYMAVLEALLYAVVAFVACLLASTTILMTYFNKISRWIESLLFNIAATKKTVT